jgi:hypothetical protein
MGTDRGETSSWCREVVSSALRTYGVLRCEEMVAARFRSIIRDGCGMWSIL